MSRARDIADIISGTITANGLNVTGDLTVTGTVDGRDVAADGTKLDGVEAGADVTDATNVAAAGGLLASNNLSEITAATARTNLGLGSAATADTTAFIATGGLKTVGSNSLEGAGDITFRSVNGTSVVGSGDISAGASTTFGAVGTYAQGRPANSNNYALGSTTSGMVAVNSRGSTAYYEGGSGWQNVESTSALSGTWRNMGGAGRNSTYNTGAVGIWVRIS